MNKTKIEWVKGPDGEPGYTWNPIPNFPRYYASKDGKILSLKKSKPRIMKPIESKSGHLYVFMYIDGVRYKVWIHRAVLSAWKGLPKEGEEGRHLDDCPKNNDIRNLEWGTRLENINDKRINGSLPEGEKSGTHKLTKEEVIEIRALHGKKSLRKLGEMYGVSHTTIRRAALGIKWSCIREGLN